MSTMSAAEQLFEKASAAALSQLNNMTEAGRGRLLNTCKKLLRALETPEETTFRYGLGINSTIAIRIGVDMGLFDAAKEISDQGDKITVNRLASHTGTDPLLVGRIMRMLGSMEVFTEVAEDTYEPTCLSVEYVTGTPLSETIVFLTSQFPRLSMIPEYLEVKGYKNPNDAFNGPFQYAMNTQMPFFEYIETKPRIHGAFNQMMKTLVKNAGEQWYQYFPVEKKLFVDSPSDALIVDVGGGVGHELIELKQKFPQLQGRLIIQDLPKVIDSITESLPNGVEIMGHDFFTPQPIQGARAYYMSTVLHDWPEKQSLSILGHIRQAMGPNSLLLINEGLLPETNAPLRLMQQDLIMMSNFSALERTRPQWQALLEEAGFELVHVWEAQETSAKVLMEAVPKHVENGV